MKSSWGRKINNLHSGSGGIRFSFFLFPHFGPLGLSGIELFPQCEASENQSKMQRTKKGQTKNSSKKSPG